MYFGADEEPGGVRRVCCGPGLARGDGRLGEEGADEVDGGGVGC